MTRKYDRTGLTKDEINARSEQMREEMLKYIDDMKGKATIRMCAKKIGVTYDAARNYGNYLAKTGSITKVTGGYETLYSATGKAYQGQRRNSKGESVADGILNIPQARVIRLMDRKPSQISKQEHQAGRRTATRSGWSSSSIGMFDSW